MGSEALTTSPPDDDLWGPETETSPPGMPPHDLKSEAAVIWAALYRDGAMIRLATLLKPGDFYSEAHRCVWEALLGMQEAGVELTAHDLAAWLQATGKYQRMGGTEYLTTLISDSPIVGRPLQAAARVASLSRLRLAQRLAHRVASRLYQPILDGEEFLAEVARDLETLRARAATQRRPVSMHESHRKAYQHAVGRADGNHPRGLSTGLRAIDAKIGGLGAGELTVLAGRPGMGKTALALRIAEHVATGGHGALFVSLEMPSDQLSARMLCAAAGVSVYDLRAGTMNARDWSLLTRTYSDSMGRKTPLLFWEWPVSIRDLHAVVKDASAMLTQSDARLELVVLDHVQLIRPGGHTRSREESVSESARSLKAIALDQGCHVIALSQLNRAVEQREDKRPLLSDLRESGAIEEAADSVLSLYRENYYDDEAGNEALVGFLKNRHGPTCAATLEFDARTIRFSDPPEAA